MKKVDVLKSGSIYSPIGPSGTLRRIQGNLEFFKSKRLDIKIITREVFADNFSLISERNQKKERTNSKIKEFIKSITPKSKLLSILHISRMIFMSRRFVRQYFNLNRKPEIIVFHDYFVFQEFLKINKSCKSKLVLFFHNDGRKFELIYNTYPKIRGTFFSKWLETQFDRSITKASKLVFISENALDTFLDLNPDYNHPNNYSFFPNGIERESKNNPVDLEHLHEFFKFKYRLCSVGSFSERKGQLKIIEALKKVNPKNLSQIGILFIGEGPDFIPAKELVSKYKLSKQIFFEGIVQNNQIPAYLKKSNIFILMSSNEGLPISIIEAMRESLPIIGTSISGVTELVLDEYNGKLIEPVAKDLTDLLNNIEHFNWIEMGDNSKAHFLEKYTFESMMENYASMILSV